MRHVSGVVVVCCLAWSASTTARSRSVWDGAYTKPQAARGKAVYDKTCTRCHGDTLLGSDDAAPLAGEEFIEKWKGKPLWKLFDIMRRTMPSDGPAVLSRAQSADLVAFLLSANTFPEGPSELTSDDAALNDILFTDKPSAVAKDK